MKKALKITLWVLGSILVILVIAGVSGWIYLSSSLLNFEKAYTEKREFEELTVEGYTFLDRNSNGKLDVYEDTRAPMSERVEDVMRQMTMEEKIHLLKGSGLRSAVGLEKEGIPGAVGTIVPTPRLGLPTIYLSDGPAGLRIEPVRDGEDRTYYCTAFPIATLLASTWNTSLVSQVGSAMGREALDYGIDVILAPGANIHRHPFCGRNFEYFSEDPVLTGFIGAAIVNGIESNGVGTSVKHFVVNNQETNRKYNDARVSERALREIYLKGFEIIVKEAQPWTLMSSYNKVNGTYVAENRELLTGVLREDWGFEGLVMSDWFGGEHAPAMIIAGNDLLEPGTKKQWDALTEAYEDGSLDSQNIDDSVRRILKLILNSRKMQNYQFGNAPDLEEHARITRQSASEGMVLLKNQGVLPITNAKNIALLGVTSYEFIAGGTGSGDVNEAYTVSLEEGLIRAGFEVNEAAKNLFESHKKAYPEKFIKPEGFKAMFEPYNPPQVSYTTQQLEAIAQSADMAIITIGRNAGEGGDRVEADDFLLTTKEQEMIEQACRVFHSAGKQVVVVLNVGGVIETASWKSIPDGILLAWQGGQEGGNSVADILSGRINPSGKLPMTFPVSVSDHEAHKNFPLEGGHMKLTDLIFQDGPAPEAEWVRNIDYTNYEEGIYVGYRHFDKAGLKVSYPFGYGLSYTDFEYNAMELTSSEDTITASLTIKNTGDVAGKEVVQLYVAKPEAAVDRPVRELKAFIKTASLEPGEEQEVVLQIPVSELRYWDEDKDEWVLESGIYEIAVGASSRDLRAVVEVEL
ncbi:beta-glucosidase [Robertkochia marina]|uniref:Beta-glucosidase n=1 Tax=Robertkochia marina TaxID=1227945 RepID=A0A4S3M2S0_9FLAO|nr:glycoside hydrolase family 3 C-terminal domain-containing protein [Robertkochia marina]THD68985.1 beta-glucosidase [Robertkochia marina]TRZ44807.1 beta-glucosidase [Robertkochia marina]